MKKSIAAFLLLLVFGVSFGQNLVRNGNFEEYSSCPTWFAQLEYCLHWTNPATNVALVSGTPDYYNACAPKWISVPNSFYGYQDANSGVAFCGIGTYTDGYVDAREYIETELASTLTAGTCYHFEMYINLPGKFKFVNDSIGVFFSPNLISGVNTYANLPFIPTLNKKIPDIGDTVNWARISGDFTAKGGEKYLIIGNFNTDKNSNIRPLNENGYYTDSYIYIDDVSVTPCSTGTDEVENSEFLNVYPNPFSNSLSISSSEDSEQELAIYDVFSRLILKQSFSKSISINTGNFARGIYLYGVTSKNGAIRRGILIKDR